jgi:hypothetical protein
MSSLSALQNRKNTSILTRADYLRISGNARPVAVDHTAETERSRQSALHERTLEVTETWANSIANERKARITRLQKEAAQQAQDHLEREHQKAKRREHLDRAERQAFEEKPEIRAVHGQLLLHEVARERQRQLLVRERKQAIEAQRESEYAADERRKYDAAMEREREIAQERRQRAVEVAAELRAQKAEAEGRRAAQRVSERDEEAMLGAEAQRLLDEEQLAESRGRERGERPADRMARAAGGARGDRGRADQGAEVRALRRDRAARGRRRRAAQGAAGGHRQDDHPAAADAFRH